MDIYKGISRDDSPHIWGFIDTYRSMARDNYSDFLEDDEALQKLVIRYHLKTKIHIALFNLSFYFIPILIYLIKKD